MELMTCLWLTIAMMLLAPSSSGFSYSASTDNSGYCAEVSAPAGESLVAISSLDGAVLSNTMSCKGVLHENHFVSGQGAPREQAHGGGIYNDKSGKKR